MPSAEPPSRRAYLDWARGVAVLLMIEAHTFDAWTRPLSRVGWPFGYAGILGGLAAPLFLWLAGLGVALSASGVARRSGSRAAAIDALCRRGLEIFILAFLFRLQSFLVTPGSYPVTIFRVDILNIMGLSIVVAGSVWGLSSSRSMLVAAYSGLAGAAAMFTPLIRAWPLVSRLPTWVQWYLRPSGDYTTFTLFPWAGFVFAGAACGVLLADRRARASERRIHLGFAVAGVALLAIGFLTASRPSIYAHSSFWTSSPTYFAIRVAILSLLVAILFGAEHLWTRRDLSERQPPATSRARVAARSVISVVVMVLARLGRSSLFIYWIHVELVYGYATWPIRQRLPLWGTMIAFTAFCGLMYAAVAGRDWLIEAWRARTRLYAVKDVAI